MKFFLKILLLMVGLNGMLPLLANQENVRGIWIVRHNMKTPESIDAMLDFAKKYQFTDLFVQIRGRGDAYYNSHHEPLAEGLAEGFDPLGYLIVKSYNRNFRIHAWINVLYLWSSDQAPKSKGHLFHKKPEWLVYPATFDSTETDSNYTNLRSEEGLYLSPLTDGVREHTKNVIDDILSQYPIEGLHFDYIRFPGYNFGFTPEARMEFKEKYILDPIDFKQDPEDFVGSFGRSGYDLYFSRWGEFLREGLSQFVDSLTTHVRMNYKDVILSAAVKPDLHKAHWRFYQEWDKWVARGWIDWAVPMNYTPEEDQFQLRLENMLRAVNPSNLAMGISLYNQSPSAAMNKAEEIFQLSNLENSLKGFVLFSYDQISQNRQLQQMYTDKILKAEGTK